jgi:hypothetical protein
VVAVVVHVVGLGLISGSIVGIPSRMRNRRRFALIFGPVIGSTVLLVTVLHAIEAATWAIAYRLLGAIPDVRSAMLYSLNAMTSYDHADLFLERHWQMMGALEALNGMMLFGLTTAFLFAMIQKVWFLGSRM